MTKQTIGSPAQGGYVKNGLSFGKKVDPIMDKQLLLNLLRPIAVLVIFVGGWELLVRLIGMPHYIFPKPSDIYVSIIENSSNLMVSVSTTVFESVLGFLMSVVLGIGLAILLALSKTLEKSLYPYVIILQTIPVIAVAPIVVIWFGAGIKSIVVISFLCSFFPIISNTLIGLNSTPENLKNLFYLYNATTIQSILRLRIPAALPYIFAGLKIACTSAIIGAIVGEYVAGVGGGKGGLGYAITVAASRVQTPYLFACGLAAALLGVLFFLIINLFSKLMLGSWHESEMKKN